jgi:ABC-2 type transport system ATP-binding protein
MSGAAVRCEGLFKRYGAQEALRGLDLEVPAGTIFGFLGPNGAGKSTTLRILAGLVRADRGEARIFGIDVRRHVAAARRTSFLVEDAVFPPHLTAREVMRRTASYMAVPLPDLAPLERVGLGAAVDRRTGGFSHGMRQRLGLACSLLGAPDLLVLDEPQNGLDPEGLRTIRSILSEERARGATVLVSVHRLAEVEGLCSNAGIVVGGQIVRQGSISRARTARSSWRPKRNRRRPRRRRASGRAWRSSSFRRCA